MKTNEILNMQPALVALAAIKLPARVAYRISKGLNKVQQIATRIQKAQNALFVQRGILNPQTGQWMIGKPESDALNAANETLRDLLTDKANAPEGSDFEPVIALARAAVEEKQAALTATVKAFQAEIEAIMEAEVQIDFIPVHISNLDGISIEPQHLAALDRFIVSSIAEIEDAA